MDQTAFNPQIAALAMPQSSALTEAGKALLSANDYLWQERIRKKQEEALGLDNSLKQQQIAFNDATNPLKTKQLELVNRHSVFDLEAKKSEEAHKQNLRPFEIKRAGLENKRINSLNKLTNAQTSEIWSNTNIEAGLGQINMAENPQQYYHNLRNNIINDENLSLKKRIELIKTVDRSAARFDLSKNNGSTEADEDMLFERIKDNPYVAGHYNALNDDGTIDNDKFYRIFSATLKKTPRQTIIDINRLMRDNQKINKSITPVIQRVAEIKDALKWARGSDGKNHAGDFLGFYDSTISSTKRLFNNDDGSNGFFQLIDYLKQDAREGLRLTRSERERQELKEITEMSPYGIIFEGREKGRLQKLINASMNAKRAKLQEEMELAENKHIKQFLAKQLADVEATRADMLEFAEAPNTQPRTQQTVWQNPPAPAQSAQANSFAQNSSANAQASSTSALSPERMREISAFER